MSIRGRTGPRKAEWSRDDETRSELNCLVYLRIAANQLSILSKFMTILPAATGRDYAIRLPARGGIIMSVDALDNSSGPEPRPRFESFNGSVPSRECRSIEETPM